MDTKYYEVTHRLLSGKVASKVYLTAGKSASLRSVYEGHVRAYPKLEILCVAEITKAEHAAWSEMATWPSYPAPQYDGMGSDGQER